jgi:hypothetical protein
MTRKIVGKDKNGQTCRASFHAFSVYFWFELKSSEIQSSEMFVIIIDVTFSWKHYQK